MVNVTLPSSLKIVNCMEASFLFSFLVILYYTLFLSLPFLSFFWLASGVKIGRHNVFFLLFTSLLPSPLLSSYWSDEIKICHTRAFLAVVSVVYVRHVVSSPKFLV